MNPLPTAEIFIELASISDADKWRGLLTGDERNAAGRIANPSVKARFETTRGLRRKMLSEVAGVDPRELSFQEDGDGKPRAENAEGWDFNVSHSGELVAVAVARGPVGVDIEMIRPVRQRQSIVARYFHPDEACAWRALDPGLREEAFFLLWSAREAAMKCLGLGLAKGLGVTRVDPVIMRNSEAPAQVGEGEVGLRRIEVPPGYVGMVALAGGR